MPSPGKITADDFSILTLAPRVCKPANSYRAIYFTRSIHFTTRAIHFSRAAPEIYKKTRETLHTFQAALYISDFWCWLSPEPRDSSGPLMTIYGETRGIDRRWPSF